MMTKPMAWQRVTNCLTCLRNEEIVVVSDVPVDYYRQRFWALAERQSEFWPEGVPTQQGRHLDTGRLLSLLESTAEPLTCRQIVIKTMDLKGLSTKRVQMLCSRMWYCLEHHRKKGVVEKVPMPQRGKKVHGWVIAGDQKKD